MEKGLTVYEQQELKRKKEERAKKSKKGKKKPPKLIGQVFLNRGEVKQVQANKENLEYYNNLYEKKMQQQG